MQNLGERRSSVNFFPRSSTQAIDSHKFLINDYLLSLIITGKHARTYKGRMVLISL